MVVIPSEVVQRLVCDIKYKASTPSSQSGLLLPGEMFLLNLVRKTEIPLSVSGRDDARAFIRLWFSQSTTYRAIGRSRFAIEDGFGRFTSSFPRARLPWAEASTGSGVR